MLLTITITVASLVAINLLLLKFSVNKINKSSKVNRKPVALYPVTSVTRNTEKLALTGS